MTYKIVSNEKINNEKLEKAKRIIKDLQEELNDCINNGCGPFIAAIYDEDYNLIAKSQNSVVKDNCSNCHAEINTIKEAERILNNYDLSQFNLKIFVTAEPCIMCLGAILWSGIKEVYYSVTSKAVESITGFDEGFKPNWLEEFKNRGITVYGNIETEIGEKVLKKYVLNCNKVYKPSR